MNKTHLKFGCLQFLLKRNDTKVQEKKFYNIHSRYSLDLVEWVVSLAAVFWMSRNAPPKERGGALRDIQKTGRLRSLARDSAIFAVFIFFSTLLQSNQVKRSRR